MSYLIYLLGLILAAVAGYYLGVMITEDYWHERCTTCLSRKTRRLSI
jgi:hypothetical protein